MSESSENPSASKPASGQPAAPVKAAPTAMRRRLTRLLWLALGPLLVFVGGAYIYMNTGRYAETDNAYVKANTVILSVEVAGAITEVAVKENQRVQAGDVLFKIDDRSHRVAVERAESQIEAVQAFIAGLQASYQRGLEELKLAHTNVAFAEREVAREQSLSERGLGSDIDLDRSRHELDIAVQQIPIIEQSLAQLRAQLGGQLGTEFEGHAAYRTARSMLKDAKLNLEHTIVRAPFDGIATRVPLIGRYIAPGNPVMSVISDHDTWIEANYKETKLTNVEPGQPVVVHIDTYPDQEWRGKVESISQATGSEFSVIPAQNASGNWVKVAQRIPVRISIAADAGDPPLRAGMSAIVEIDTGFARTVPPILGFMRKFQRSDSTAAAQPD